MEPVNLLLLAEGFVKTFDQEYSMAEVLIRAYYMDGHSGWPMATAEPIILATTYSASDGSFQLFLRSDDPGANLACYLQNCASPVIFLHCYDIDESLLVETKPSSVSQLQGITLQLPPTLTTPGSEDWQRMGELIQESQLMTLDLLALELTNMGPLAIFRGFTVQQRLSYLYGLENALVDPEGLFLESGLSINIATLQNFDTRAVMRRQVIQLDNAALTQAFDAAVIRADIAGGHLHNAELLLNPGEFKKGSVIAGVNSFFGKDKLLRPGGEFILPGISDIFPVLKSPLVGYRDYLVDIWVKRATQQLKEGQLLDANGAVQQLNNRFHQNFRTGDVSDQPANQLVNAILLSILTSPTGMDFGFGIAPADIEPQGEMTNGEYLHYLISLTGVEVHELENRYRIDLTRSDFEFLNPVQQNINTLKRFFTDSFQSPYDPYAILPLLTGNGLPIINDFTYPGQVHGPFFWQYEEWLERNEPFYAENYFDIRNLFKVYMWDEQSKKAIWGRTHSLAQILSFRLDSKELKNLTPPLISASNTVTAELLIGDQWSRILVELQDLLNDAHKDFFAGFFSEAERKYVELMKNVYYLNILLNRWKGTSWDKYNPAVVAAEQRAFKIKDPESLEKFEQNYHLTLGYSTQGNTGYDFFTERGGIAKTPYLLDMVLHRLLPACLTETRLSLGNYRDAVQGSSKPYAYDSGNYPKMETNLASLASFGVFTGPTPVEPGSKATPVEEVWWTPSYKPNTGSLPFATDNAVANQDRRKTNVSLFPANAMEKTYFSLKLGDVLLEWADQLYRTNQPQSINRARELYKGVLFLHGEDPEIFPTWSQWQARNFFPFWIGKLVQNPLLTTQINRAGAGFDQINAGLNYYGFPKDYVPPVRYRVLKEAALGFTASAKSAQNDYLSYMTKYEQAVLDEMTTRTMVEKASYAVGIADEQIQIAQFAVGEAQKQVQAVKAQIAAKQQEIKDSESFFSQLGDFFSGMKDAAEGLGKSALGSINDSEGEAAGGSVNWGAMYKVISSKGGTSAASAGLTGGMALMAGYGAFVYAGVTSMQSLEAAANKRMGELKGLQEVALPAAEKMVELKQKEVKIAGLQKAIAQADYNLGQKMLAFYGYRFLSKAFWQQLSKFANRLMRRYLDLGGRTAWFAERALSFEMDKNINVISFDYFPKQLRGVTGADTLQLHLAEMEAIRIYSLSQTIPVKQTFSMVRDFPIAFGQLKKTGICRFFTSEAPLKLSYPGVYGYRLRCVSVGVSYADEAMPHKGMLNNFGYSWVSRNDDSTHRLVRYPDALPLSEFNMRNDMYVYDLPDETLLPFEGSGIETAWELSLSRLGNATDLDKLTDILLTFDMRARYSASLETKHRAALPMVINKSVLISGKAQNPGAVGQFKKNGGQLVLNFQPALAAGNVLEKMRTIRLIALMLSGVDQSPVTATLSAKMDGLASNFDFVDGIAVSNAGFLAGANAGVPLPLNDLTGINADQEFILTIDSNGNAGVDFSKMYDVQLFVEYEAQV